MKTKLSKKTKKAICIYLAVLLLLYIVVQLLPKVTDVFETTQILRPGTLKLSYETCLLYTSLNTGWKLLSILPDRELKRIKPEMIEKYSVKVSV